MLWHRYDSDANACVVFARERVPVIDTYTYTHAQRRAQVLRTLSMSVAGGSSRTQFRLMHLSAVQSRAK
eukprot:56153-Eustigmatos_ZCMA.PRE.1